MNETVLLYGLMVSTILNTLLLLVLLVGFIKLWLTASKLISRIESILERGEREVMATIAVGRNALRQGGNFLGKVTQMLERYLFFSAMKRFTSSPQSSRLMTFLGIGYGVFQSLRQFMARES